MQHNILTPMLPRARSPSKTEFNHRVYIYRAFVGSIKLKIMVYVGILGVRSDKLYYY